jgi:hypothetical protein
LVGPAVPAVLVVLADLVAGAGLVVVVVVLADPVVLGVRVELRIALVGPAVPAVLAPAALAGLVALAVQVVQAVETAVLVGLEALEGLVGKRPELVEEDSVVKSLVAVEGYLASKVYWTARRPVASPAVDRPYASP